jgi:hypothetical protein
LESSAACKVKARLLLEEDPAAAAADLYEFRARPTTAVRVEIQGMKIGYLDPSDEGFYPEAYRRLLNGLPIEVDALIVGGWYRPPGDWGRYGVRLAVDVREDVAC